MSSTTSNTDPSLSYLTEAELKAYQTNKANWFKGTIAVCVVYGVFALILLLIAIFDVRGRQLLSENFLPFTITFIGGMIVVIILLVVQITTFKPKTFQHGLYDKDICPDYWKAVPVNPNEIPSGTASDQYLMRVKCVPDDSIYNLKTRINTTDSKVADLITNDTAQTTSYNQKVIRVGNNDVYYATKGTNDTTMADNKLFDLSQKMYGSNLGNATLASLSNIRCDMFYPSLMAKEDELNFKDQPNTLRCKYAQKCGISWSSVCPM